MESRQAVAPGRSGSGGTRGSAGPGATPSLRRVPSPSLAARWRKSLRRTCSRFSLAPSVSPGTWCAPGCLRAQRLVNFIDFMQPVCRGWREWGSWAPRPSWGRTGDLGLDGHWGQLASGAWVGGSQDQGQNPFLSPHRGQQAGPGYSAAGGKAGRAVPTRSLLASPGGHWAPREGEDQDHCDGSGRKGAQRAPTPVG